MANLGIIPSPPGEYLELAKSPAGRVFRKHILNLGPLIHPKTGKVLQLDDQFYATLKRNFDAGVSMVQVPLADEKNLHSEAPERNTGEVIGLERDGSKVYAVLDIRDPAVAEKLASKTLMGASAMLHMDYRDTRTGEKVGPTLLHSCITNRPYVVGLDDYAEVVAATAEAFDVLPDGSVLAPTVLMLCASEVDADPPVLLADPELADPELQPDYQPEPDYRDYGGAAGMDEDYLRDEAARLGLLAYQESCPGRGSKPEYGIIITDRDRQAALSAAETEDTDENVLKVMSGLAEHHQVSFSAVSCMAHDAHVRSGLGHSVAERAAVLGACVVALSAGQLEVSDEQVLALSANGGSEHWVSDAEIIRLTSDEQNEDMFGLAHPAKSGRVTTKTRAHVPDEEDATTEDPDAAIERYLKMHAEEWGAEARHAGSHGSTSYPPKSPQQREAEEKRARAGHQGDMRSIPDYARGSARTRSGR